MYEVCGFLSSAMCKHFERRENMIVVIVNERLGQGLK